MNRWSRISLIILSFLLALISLILLAMFISSDILSGMITLLVRLMNHTTSRNIVLAVFALSFIFALAVLVNTVLSGRLRRARVREGNMGVIDIGVDAIESIALNAAKSAQAGVKAAKAHIAPFKGDKLTVRLNVMAYSNVELPAMMVKVQERVKKDIERYTGIEVAEVEVKVTRVDAIEARVER